MAYFLHVLKDVSLLREKPATPEDIAEEKRQIALLEKSMEENKELLANLEQVRELEKKIRAERDAEEEKAVAIQKEFAEIEGLLDTIKNFNWGDTRGQTIGILINPTGYYMTLVIRPDLEKSGSPLEELSKPGGEFAKAIPVIRQSMRSVLLYRLHPDSFETYLAARELSEKVNIAAGWDVNDSTEFKMGIPGLTVRRLQEPPAPPPGTLP